MNSNPPRHPARTTRLSLPKQTGRTGTEPASQSARPAVGRSASKSPNKFSAAPKQSAAAEQNPARTEHGLPVLASDSLGSAMVGAARACAEVRAGRSLQEALRPVLAHAATPQARGAIQDLAYRSMRGRGRADVMIEILAQRVPEPALLRELLVVALTLLDPASPTAPGTEANSEPRYAPFTVVNQAVEACAALPELQRSKGFVNAILRNALREAATLASKMSQNEEARWNYPQWWISRLRDAWPQQWEEILAVGNRQPPLTLRVNLRKTGMADCLARLAQAGLAATQIGPQAIRLADPVAVERIPGFAEGWLSVQDEAAQRAAPLLDVHPGMRVLDACAAPGGKSGHLLELADIDLTALDSDPTRLTRVSENLARLGFVTGNDAGQTRLVCGNAATPTPPSGNGTGWWDGRPFDRILADVPCTASGIVRRHPDIRWLRRATDIAALARTQRQILDGLWQTLAPGGRMLLVTCSIFPEESAAQARNFLTRHGDAQALPAPGQLLPINNSSDDHDGLFFALFGKIA